MQAGRTRAHRVLRIGHQVSIVFIWLKQRAQNKIICNILNIVRLLIACLKILVSVIWKKTSLKDPHLPSKNGDYGSTDTGTSGGMGSDQTAAAQKRQENNSDIRCALIATELMKNTTSRSDYDNRAAVAKQLIANANLQNGPASRILTSLWSYFNRKTGRYDFKVTYANGGSEWWSANPAIGSISVVPYSNNSLYLGDGVVKSNDDCSKKG